MGRTDFLFARPSFIEGMARSIDLYGVLQEYNRCRTEEEADSWAIYNDFQVIGDDITNSIKSVKTEVNLGNV